MDRIDPPGRTIIGELPGVGGTQPKREEGCCGSHDRPGRRVSAAAPARVRADAELHHVVMVCPVRCALVVIQAVCLRAALVPVDVIVCRLRAWL